MPPGLSAVYANRHIEAIAYRWLQSNSSKDEQFIKLKFQHYLVSEEGKREIDSKGGREKQRHTE